jgi:hypothetical protein
MLLALDWTSGYGLVLAVATGITVIGGAIVLVVTSGHRMRDWLRPAKPLIAFGHPQDCQPPWIFFGGSDAEMEAQTREHERFRLSRLIFSYLIENKGDTPIRNATTGIRTRDGREHRFEDWFVQILAGRESAPVENVEVPHDLHAGLTDENRAVNFLFWLRFEDDKRRRWEAAYDARSRDLSYTRE